MFSSFTGLAGSCGVRVHREGEKVSLHRIKMGRADKHMSLDIGRTCKRGKQAPGKSFNETVCNPRPNMKFTQINGSTVFG